jgi:parallel beta-helix repeat protein
MNAFILLILTLLVAFSSSSLAQDNTKNAYIFISNQKDKCAKYTNTMTQQPCRVFATVEEGFSFLQNASATNSATAATTMNDFFENADKVIFNLDPGTYRIAAPVNLKWNPTNSAQKLLIQGSLLKKTILSGAVAINSKKFIPDETEKNALPPEIIEKLRYFQFPDQIKNIPPPDSIGFGQAPKPLLIDSFSNDARLNESVWPKEGYARISKTNCQNKPDAPIQLESIDAASSSWKPQPIDTQGFIRGFFFWDWAEEQINFSATSASQADAVQLKRHPMFGIRCGGARVKVFNTLANITQPGEAFNDFAHRRVIYLPAKNAVTPPEVSVAQSLLNITQSNNVEIQNIKFEKVLGDAILVNESRNIQFNHVKIRHTGNRAIIFQNSWDSGILNSSILDNGEGGITLSGGDRNTLNPANLYAKNNQIQNFDRLIGSYRPAITVIGVGNQAVQNKISNGQHAAIIFGGNNHLIENNDISEVGLSTMDVGAIYTGRDWSARGNKIISNYIHDLPIATKDNSDSKFGVTAIYLDDQASGEEVKYNIIQNAYRGIFVGGGRDNTIKQNVFLQTLNPILIDRRGLEWQKADSQSPNGFLMKNLQKVPYGSEIYLSQYPGLADALDNPGEPRRNVISTNAADQHSLQAIDAKVLDGYVFKRNFAVSKLPLPLTTPLKKSVASALPSPGLSTTASNAESSARALPGNGGSTGIEFPSACKQLLIRELQAEQPSPEPDDDWSALPNIAPLATDCPQE